MPSKIEHDFAPDGTEVKRCARCTVWKGLEQYTKEKRRADGLCYNCKQCLKEVRHERLEKDKEYRKNNREKVNKWKKNEREKKKENPDDVFIKTRIKENLARRLRFLLNGTQKSARTCEIIGCSPEELKIHLEKTFTEGMSWDNYGEWHIDHMIPCAAFDHEDENELKACWNFRNLRALWGSENLKKSSIFDHKEKEEYMMRLFN